MELRGTQLENCDGLMDCLIGDATLSYGRYFGGSVIYENLIYVISGEGSISQVVNYAIDVFDVQNETMVYDDRSYPHSNDGVSLILVDNVIYSFGGSNSDYEIYAGTIGFVNACFFLFIYILNFFCFFFELIF